MIFFPPSQHNVIIYYNIYIPTDATVRAESEAGASYMFANVNIARNTYIYAHFICIRKCIYTPYTRLLHDPTYNIIYLYAYIYIYIYTLCVLCTYV